MYVGTDSGTANEPGDRANITLPGAQAQMISQVAARNPNTVVYLETVGQVDVTGFEAGVPAMLWSSFNGMRKGEALADVLFGAVNPSGRLPFTWYRSEAQLPAITDYTIRPGGSNLGRTYMYFQGDVSYPFGFGLGYSTFRYSNVQVDSGHVDANGTVKVCVDVTNTGRAAGSEVAQLYVDTPDAPAALQRPIKRLKGFQKLTLAPHQTRKVTFSVRVADLAFFDEKAGRYVVDNGRYGVQISKSSADADIQAQDFVQVAGTLHPVLNVVTVKPTQEGDAVVDIPTRVIFQAGKVILPQITAAMNDETLYGYIKKGGSVPLPAGMSVQYSSNRPEAVSVGADGVIRAVASGVATVTATVTYEGVSKSTDFVVRIVADVSLSDIKVNGASISEFSPTVFSYDVIIPFSETLPNVEATATDPAATVTLVQATSVPGQATVTVTSGYEQAVYTVSLRNDVSLSSIKVNGKPVSTFSPSVFSYGMLVPYPALSVPYVEATPIDPAATVAITQATGVPGEATITVSIGSQQAVYRVAFGYASVSDEFDSDTLGSQWSWIREDPRSGGSKAVR